MYCHLISHLKPCVLILKHCLSFHPHRQTELLGWYTRHTNGRLRVVPHFFSGIVERAKRECARENHPTRKHERFLERRHCYVYSHFSVKIDSIKSPMRPINSYQAEFLMVLYWGQLILFSLDINDIFSCSNYLSFVPPYNRVIFSFNTRI